jgi:two-component system, NtrC family, response regulator AtoC
MEKTQKSALGQRMGNLSAPAVRAACSPGSPDRLREVIITTDVEGVITGCNQAVGRYGYAAAELIGTKLADLYRAEDQESLVTAVCAKGRFEHAADCRSKSGEHVRVQISLTRVHGAQASPDTLVVIATENTKIVEVAPYINDGRSAAPPHSLAHRVVDGTQFLIASALMHKFMDLVDKVAVQTETVLVTGETGTGKELVARTIHESSYRRKRPLIDINCAALPEHLVESELFGYEKGAFSGADSSKPGLFELADKSTIFLDEIGELQPQVQVKLLRVLDGAPYYRLGGHRKITVDVRVVAATNQDLESAVKEGRFRKDLFHRLSQFQLRVPPLRERPEDIGALAQHFLTLKASEKSFSPDALAALRSHPWPGNVRELRNLVAKLAMSAPERQVAASLVLAELSGEQESSHSRTAMPLGNLDNMEEQMIIRALEQTGGHRAQAAEQLGISRRTLSRKLREYGIDVPAGDRLTTAGAIIEERQKFFRAKVSLLATLRNAHGKELPVRALNLSTGGMGLDEIPDPAVFAGVLDVSFRLPETDTEMQVKGRLVWADVGGRAGLRFVVIEPRLFEELQRWTNQKMKNEGWELPS